ncbi:hypothetical protein MUK42_33055 [Musa troglodytarum]|uniref:Uncharacterized protein n=1 Tax=Musa troglodytarum TaxID=320322 RepID=A0A9E7L4V2_9LILI|nr:hypothetical protein MUK42_33055 [Musa troglodytarum]
MGINSYNVKLQDTYLSPRNSEAAAGNLKGHPPWKISSVALDFGNLHYITTCERSYSTEAAERCAPAPRMQGERNRLR